MIEYTVSFVAVVKAGSYSSAAKNTGVSKACLSRHVKQLETMLGVSLLHRTTRSVQLTQEGQIFFEACESIEENYQEAVSRLKQDFQGMEGTLRVTAPIDFGIQFLPNVMDAFSKHYPKINLIVNLSNTNESLIEKNYDLAIRIAHELPDSNLRARSLFHFKRLICASPDYLKQHPISSLEDLKEHRCITSVNYHPNTVNPHWQFMREGKAFKYILNKSMQVDSLFAQMDLVKKGCGIGRLPDYFVQDALRAGELVEVLKSIDKPDSTVYVLFPDVLAVPQKTRTFIDLLQTIEFFASS